MIVFHVMCPFCSFNPVAFLEISSRMMDLDANKDLLNEILYNTTLNSRINMIHMEKVHLFRHFPWYVLEFCFVNNKFNRLMLKSTL